MLYVRNAVGTSDKKCPYGYDSWLDFWEKRSNRSATYCRCCGKPYVNLVGGHVQIVTVGIDGKWHSSPQLYIVPICQDCNVSGSQPIHVDANDLVKAE